MAGIASYGVHLPRLRMPLNLIQTPAATPGPAEKAVAGFDEDSLTMAVSAAGQCLGGRDRAVVDQLHFVSTTPVFVEKSSAAIMARALNLRDDVLTVDHGGSLKGAGAALRAALDAVDAGRARAVLVAAADARTAEPYSAQELHFGDAAAALLVTADGPLRLEADSLVNRPLYDVWREAGADTVRSWEDRFVVQHGYRAALETAWGQLLAGREWDAAGVDAFACFGPDARSHAALARQLGLTREQVVDPLFGRIGNCGAAMTPLLLAQALAQAQPGQRLVTGFYGDGAHFMSWCLDSPLEPDPERMEVAQQLQARIPLNAYRTYLQSRGLDVNTAPVQPTEGISATVHWREQDADIAFLGARCRECGTEQFPPSRLCYGCQGRDCLEPVSLSRRRGHIASYTEDYFFPSATPPLVAGMCEVEGGARVYVQLADYNGEPLRTGLPVNFVFRKIHQAGGKPAYFWKSRLIQTPEDSR